MGLAKELNTMLLQLDEEKDSIEKIKGHLYKHGWAYAGKSLWRAVDPTNTGGEIAFKHPKHPSQEMRIPSSQFNLKRELEHHVYSYNPEGHSVQTITRVKPDKVQEYLKGFHGVKI